ELPLAVLTYQSRVSISEIYQRFKPEVWAPHYRDLSLEKMAQANDVGMAVIPYTVNTLMDFKEMIQMGVAGLTTDDPTLLIQFLK
ncbi:MAG: glycerophosphodiester phosphodiesterase, partial [Deltaproteobacteria bacterium]